MRKAAHPERSFGISVGTVLLLISAYAIWHGRTTLAAGTGSIGFVLLGLGLTRPSALRIPSAIWWRFALVLGAINTRVILTLAFVLVCVPVGLVWRLIRYDPLARNRRAMPGWTLYPARYRDPSHYSRMY